jgi:hypothetical protein
MRKRRLVKTTGEFHTPTSPSLPTQLNVRKKDDGPPVVQSEAVASFSWWHARGAGPPRLSIGAISPNKRYSGLFFPGVSPSFSRHNQGWSRYRGIIGMLDAASDAQREVLRSLILKEPPLYLIFRTQLIDFARLIDRLASPPEKAREPDKSGRDELMKHLQNVSEADQTQH